MKRREFLENISFFLHGLHCFLPPSFYILFVLPLFLLTSQVIAWDCSAPKSLSVCTLSFSLTKIFFRKREDTAVYTVHECRDLALTLLTSEAKGISRHCFPWEFPSRYTHAQVNWLSSVSLLMKNDSFPNYPPEVFELSCTGKRISFPHSSL
jgi:hypothetical protein